MSARQPLSPPDMSGLDDVQRILELRRQTKNTQASEPDISLDDATTSRRHDVTKPDPAAATPPARRARPTTRRPAPRAADAVALTVRLDQTEATELDLLLLELRKETGRRLDKAEIVRELLRLTREHTGTRQTLVRRLKA